MLVPQEKDATWRPLVAGILAIAVGMGIGRFSFTTILPAMRDAFALSPAALASLASANYLGYLVGALAATAPVPPRAHQAILRISLLLVVVGTGLMAGTTAAWSWLLLRFLAGLASAGIFVFGSTIVFGWLEQQGRATLSGAFFSGVGMGIAGSGSVVLSLQHVVTGAEVWRWAWLATALLAALLTGLSWAWLPPRTKRSASGHQPRAVVGDDVRWLPVLLLGTAYFLAGVGYIVAGTFLVAIVAALPQAGDLGVGAWILVGLTAAPSTILWAWLARRLRSLAALGGAYLAQAAALVLPVISHHAAGAMVAALLFGGSFMGITALTIAEARRRVPPRLAARTIGSFTALFALGQVIGPLLAASLVSKAGAFDLALLVAAGTVVVGAVLVLGVGFLI
jgi:predicted MFS family arabinose efflux permease